MARIRSIKPEFWSDTRMARLPALARLVFLYLISMADDEGRMEGNAETVWRYGGFREDSREIANALEALRGLGRVVFYEVAGNPYIAVANFRKHQRVDHPTPSKLPAPSEACDLLSESLASSREDSRVLALDQGSRIKDQGSRKEVAPSVLPVPAASGDPVDKSDRIPYEQIVAVYHELLPMLPKVVALTEARRAAIRQRWRSGALPDLEAWRAYFEHVAASPFLTGMSSAGRGRDRPFVADLEWLCKEANFVKVWEGRYHRAA